MDKQTYESISRRLDVLEVAIGQGSETESTLIEQVSHLQKRVKDVYQQTSEFDSLQRMLKSLGLWDSEKIIPRERNAKQLHEHDQDQDQDQVHKDIHHKRTELLLNYTTIKEAYDNLTKLSTLDTTKLINYIDSSQDKTHNFNDDMLKIISRKDDLEWISSTFHALVVKNIIVFEKYMNLVVTENQFWLDTEDKLRKLQTSINQIEIKEKLKHKY
ncbi:uncharacterized protein RJT21DRAFT_3936 [Scheffersomyces amazonensis]|uniref:uncharacterized protein n=1 Tax=Scheffersomyces amazonensis TaxID=1078765 RepID=UPI00315D52FC